MFLFLECIDTERAFLNIHTINGRDNYNAEDGEDRETGSFESNARLIVPLFHELQMDEYLKKCDYSIIFNSSIDFYLLKWVNHEARSLILRLLSFSIKYGLIVTQKYVQRQIETVLERFC